MDHVKTAQKKKWRNLSYQFTVLQFHFYYNTYMNMASLSV